MSGIKRWDWVNQMVRGDDGGRFVKYADHEAEVARLRAEVEKVRGYEVAPLEEQIAKLVAENGFLRQMVRDANHNQDFDFDAAMGASA